MLEELIEQKKTDSDVLSKQLDAFINAQEISSQSGISHFTVQKILKMVNFFLTNYNKN